MEVWQSESELDDAPMRNARVVADDNASGIAGLLELPRAINPYSRFSGIPRAAARDSQNGSVSHGQGTP
jgi:hypothetical protein